MKNIRTTIAIIWLIAALGVSYLPDPYQFYCSVLLVSLLVIGAATEIINYLKNKKAKQ